MTLKTQTPAPDFSLQSTTGEQISISEACKSGHHILLIFLRHLGCVPCREHALQVCARQDEFAKLNTRVFIISFGTLLALQQWMQEVCGDFTVLLDRERSVYTAYQIDHSRLRSWHPRVLWVYIKRWLRGEPFFDSHGDDTSQLGGDFIVDKNGILQLVHPSYDPTDRPSVDHLLEILKNL